MFSGESLRCIDIDIYSGSCTTVSISTQVTPLRHRSDFEGYHDPSSRTFQDDKFWILRHLWTRYIGQRKQDATGFS